MPRKVGLPESINLKHNVHLVDEISTRTKTTIIRNIPISRIIPNTLQPRKDYGDLKDLADSIKEKGIIEPILVRPKDGGFELIAGERRFKAAEAAGLTEVPCIEYDIEDNEALELSIIENIQRKDLNVFEQAYSLKSLAEIYGYTHQDIAKKIAKSRVTVTELIKISELQEDIAKKCIELGINSKSFILELAKIKNREEIEGILHNYARHPFSRDDLKNYRRQEHEEKPKEGEVIKPVKFNFTSEDKRIKINFKVNDQNVQKVEIINILKNIIKEIEEGKFKELE